MDEFILPVNMCAYLNVLFGHLKSANYTSLNRPLWCLKGCGCKSKLSASQWTVDVKPDNENVNIF